MALLLQAGIHLGEGHGDRRGAQRADRFLPDRRRRGADSQALQVIGLADRLVGEEVAIALHPAERQHLEAELARQLFLPLEDRRRLAQLGHVLEGLDEVGAVHHRDAGHVVAHARRVGVLADVGAGADLLEDVLLLAELRAVEHVDLESALGARLDRLGPFHEPVVVRLLRSQHVVEFQVVLGLAVGERSGKAQRQRDDDSRFHVRSSY